MTGDDENVQETSSFNSNERISRLDAETRFPVGYFCHLRRRLGIESDHVELGHMRVTRLRQACRLKSQCSPRFTEGFGVPEEWPLTVFTASHGPIPEGFPKLSPEASLTAIGCTDDATLMRDFLFQGIRDILNNSKSRSRSITWAFFGHRKSMAFPRCWPISSFVMLSTGLSTALGVCPASIPDCF